MGFHQLRLAVEHPHSDHRAACEPDVPERLYQNPQVSTPFNTSLVGFLQAIGYAVNGPSGAQAVASHIQRDVSIEELIGGLLVLAYLVLVERKPWRAMTVVTAAILLLPEVSGYYGLAYLLAPAGAVRS